LSKILLIDDEPMILEILEETFRIDYKFQNLMTAGDGLDAFHLCMLHQFDLICLDHMMPFLKGADLLAALRSKPGPNHKTPVIMISAYIPDIPESIKHTDDTFFLEKPIDLDRLKRYVKLALYKGKDAAE
jgi:two-component system sensor histidine kinase BarA